MLRGTPRTLLNSFRVQQKACLDRNNSKARIHTSILPQIACRHLSFQEDFINHKHNNIGVRINNAVVVDAHKRDSRR